METLGALVPISPSLSSFAEATTFTLTYTKYADAMNYAASRTNVIKGKGLLFPQKSRVWQAKMADVRATAGAGTLISLDLAIVQGFYTEMKEMSNGGCR